MSTRISYKTMTDAELIDEGLDHEPGTLAYELAVTLDAMPMRYGLVVINDEDPSSGQDCSGCDELQNEVDSLEHDVSKMQSKLDNNVVRINKVELKAASCPSCKAPINVDYFEDLSKQTVMNGGAYGQAYYCKNCDHLMMVLSSSSTTITLTTTEPKP